jgi:hypothetical protein
MSEDTKYHEQDEPPNIRGFSAFDLDRLESELASVTEQRDRLAEVAQAVWDRWETPLWKDHPPTALVMNKLRDALEAVKGGSDECR